ncbi:hypothetical protein FA13DRAFT_1731849 [Coprinellus micaceus]|uniref:Uncharacterized protein n=1 Tax=Coprinellus micaceus TaxID=71717 RepID=A0A4Y7TD82_COPMI|nr:hypothetical protein FA13DRAFT_1731849 [Coprinellus micaceus]
MKGALKRAATGFIKRQQRGEPGDEDIGEGRNEKKNKEQTQMKAKKKRFRLSFSGLRLESDTTNCGPRDLPQPETRLPSGDLPARTFSDLLEERHQSASLTPVALSEGVLSLHALLGGLQHRLPSPIVPEERAGTQPAVQSLMPCPASDLDNHRGLNAFTGSHSFRGETLDFAVAGGNMTRVVEINFHVNGQLLLGGSVAGQSEAGPWMPSMRSGRHFPCHILLNGILLSSFFLCFLVILFGLGLTVT